MGDSTKAALAASVAAGYMLGRGRRMKLALAVATYLASGRIRAKPQELLAAGAGRLGESPQLSQLTEQVRTELLTVGRQALKAAVDHRLGTFADSLAERTKSLSQAVDSLAEEAGEEADDREPQQEAREEEDDREPQEEPDGKRDGREARSTAKQQRRGAPRRESAESPSSQKTGKRPAKKAPPRKAARRATQKSTESSSRRR